MDATPSKSSEVNFHFIVPVWGDTFTKLFADIGLPMIMTPGNLGNSKGRSDQFLIVTTWIDRLTIINSNSYKRLQELVEVKFVLTDGLVDTSNTHTAMSEFYAMGMRYKKVSADGTYFVFLTPDSLWPEGTFRHLRYLAEQGFQVVMSAGLRANEETMSIILKQRIEKFPDNPALSNEELVKIVFDNLHQLSTAFDCLSGNGFLNCWPATVCWINKQDLQYISHYFHLHPLMVLAPNTEVEIGTTIDGEFMDNLPYSLDRYHVLQRDFIGIDLAPTKRNWGQPLQQPSISEIIKFGIFHANSRHWHFFSKRIIMNGRKDMPIDSDLEKLIDTFYMKVQRYHILAILIQKLHLKRLVRLILRIKNLKLARLRRFIRRLLPREWA